MLDFIFELIGEFLTHVLGHMRWWVILLIVLVIALIILCCCV